MATIIITGAGAGLGRALARRFAADGDDVIMLGRTLSKLQEEAGSIGERATAIQCDVSSPDSVRNAFEIISGAHARIDVLINNAALFEPFLIADATDAQILKIIGTNVVGPVLCCRAAIPLLGAGGHIINLSSESVDMHFPHLTLYQASKAAVERFSKSMHLELEPAGIRVTLVRAGAMMEEGKVWDVDPAVRMRFARAAMEAGVNLRDRPVSQYDAVTDVFRAILDMPADVHIESVSVHARHAGT